MQITEHTFINDIVKANQSTFFLFWKHGIIGAGSPYLKRETLASICEIHQLDVDVIIDELIRL